MPQSFKFGFIKDCQYFLESAKNEVDTSDVIGEFWTPPDDKAVFLDQNQMAANWMLYQICLHRRAEDMMSESKTRDEIEKVIEWLSLCEESIQDKRRSEPFPTIPEIIFRDNCAS